MAQTASFGDWAVGKWLQDNGGAGAAPPPGFSWQTDDWTTEAGKQKLFNALQASGQLQPYVDQFKQSYATNGGTMTGTGFNDTITTQDPPKDSLMDTLAPWALALGPVIGMISAGAGVAGGVGAAASSGDSIAASVGADQTIGGGAATTGAADGAIDYSNTTQGLQNQGVLDANGDFIQPSGSAPGTGMPGAPPVPGGSGSGGSSGLPFGVNSVKDALGLLGTGVGIAGGVSALLNNKAGALSDAATTGLQAQTAIAQQLAGIAQDQWNVYKTNVLPLLGKMSSMASEDRTAQVESDAASQTAGAYGTARQNLVRAVEGTRNLGDPGTAALLAPSYTSEATAVSNAVEQAHIAEQARQFNETQQTVAAYGNPSGQAVTTLGGASSATNAGTTGALNAATAANTQAAQGAYGGFTLANNASKWLTGTTPTTAPGTTTAPGSTVTAPANSINAGNTYTQTFPVDTNGNAMPSPQYRDGGAIRVPRYADGGAVADAAPIAQFDKNFNTMLTPEGEAEFQKWKAQHAPRDSGEDYDLRGAFITGMKPGADGHWSDEFKKPNHPTFSNQSRYSNFGAPGTWAGTWNPATRTYTPPTNGPDKFTPGKADGGVIEHASMRMEPIRTAVDLVTGKSLTRETLTSRAGVNTSDASRAITVPGKDYSENNFGKVGTYNPVRTQGRADGGAISGPGTGTSDSILTAKRPGTYILSADTVRAIGTKKIEDLAEKAGVRKTFGGNGADPDPGGVPVRLSNGEHEIPPEVVQHYGEEFFNKLQQKYHRPVVSETGMANGGAIRPRSLPRSVEDAIHGHMNGAIARRGS